MNEGQRLKTPQGTEGFYLEEAYRHRQLLRMIEDHFTSWGYLPVLTPVFDYYETYRPLLDQAQIKRSYRFPDRDGELLILRSDITLFLAKQMGLAMKKIDLPQRVYYADSILRHQEEGDISNDEFFQGGAELIGLAGSDGDREILLMLHELLDAMKLPQWRMHLGSRAVLDALLEGRCDTSIAASLLETRDREALFELLSSSGLTEAGARIQLLFFLGTSGEFASAITEFSDAFGKDEGQNILNAARELQLLAEGMKEIIPMDRIRIDLSENGSQPYYTGFTVRVYVEGSAAAVATGGRYDDLLGHFGPNIPAAGFSLLMRKIEPLSAYAEEAAGNRSLRRARGKRLLERYIDAKKGRKAGERVLLT